MKKRTALRKPRRKRSPFTAAEAEAVLGIIATTCAGLSEVLKDIGRHRGLDKLTRAAVARCAQVARACAVHVSKINVVG